ncbi:MAG: hypothetical protein HY897_20300 [Deltaproteobacteria bacterium]|nr:hypothetical protein [Deltaproteobacteria bacterium]
MEVEFVLNGEVAAQARVEENVAARDLAGIRAFKEKATQRMPRDMSAAPPA